MALDFPASPTDGQLYTGANGVIYQWSAAKGLWLAVPAMITPPGDFYAYTTSGAGITTTPSVVVFSTVYSGNVGSYYNPANGRFTPPAGRYRMTAGVNWYSSSTTIGAHIAFRKNGVQVNNAINNASQGTNYYALSIAEMTFDANGTDYFEVQAASSGPTPSGVAWMWFSAQPIGVIVPNQLLGEFQVTHNASFSLPTNSFTTLSWNTVLAGNTGSWYSSATGRYTPPAGRHRLFGTLQGLCTSAIYVAIQFTKNGTALLPMINYNVAANIWGVGSAERIVDANGTDWFDMQGFTSVGGAGSQFNGTFGATPIRV